MTHDPGATELHGLTGLPYGALPIRTERLLLRPFAEDDLADAFEYQKREDVVRYLLWEVHSPEESAKRVEARITMTRLANDGDELVFAVELADPAGYPHVVGEMIVLLDSAMHGQLEVGWIFHPSAHGRGLASEAARAILALCFDALGAHRVLAKLDPRNESSARLCERLGMRREALLHEDHIAKGEWASTAIYALSALGYAAGDEGRADP